MTKAEIWEIAPAWVKAWEKFAGRPYNKAENSKKPGTIKDIVRRGQNALGGMALHACGERLREHLAAYMKKHNPSYTMTNEETGAIYYTPFSSEIAGPPQSLGELCLDVGNDYGWSSCGNHIWYRYFPKFGLLEISRGDIQQLKQAMWHKTPKTGESHEIAGKC